MWTCTIPLSCRYQNVSIDSSLLSTRLGSALETEDVTDFEGSENCNFTKAFYLPSEALECTRGHSQRHLTTPQAFQSPVQSHHEGLHQIF